MNRIYINWEYWECYKNGMYRNEANESNFVKKAKKFMSNTKRFATAMFKVIRNWKNTMLHHLSNSSINKRAFLGQCACCFAINCPESIVRIAWKELSQESRDKADKEAQILIDEYIKRINERQNNTIHIGLGVQMLLQWNT